MNGFFTGYALGVLITVLGIYMNPFIDYDHDYDCDKVESLEIKKGDGLVCEVL